MPRHQKPFIVYKRKDSRYFYITLNITSGLPFRVCREWYRKSFHNFPPELSMYYDAKSKAAAEAGAMALITYLQNMDNRYSNKHDTTVGEWLVKFTSIAESPKSVRLIAKNRPYSEQSVDRLKGLYEVHMKDDPFMGVLMSEVDTQEALAFINRMGMRKLEGGRYQNKKEQPLMVGTESFAKLVKFIRMAFKEYGRISPNWHNVFQNIDAPNYEYNERDAMPEEEAMKLFSPEVLLDKMELAVCSAMFLAGLRRSEVFALKPEDLDWKTPKITVRRAWQNFTFKKRKLGPPKGKKSRLAPFGKFFQDAIKALWEENGQHEFVFSYKDGTTPGPSWIKGRFKKWLARAGIELKGRELVPHSSRHSLAEMLENRNVPLRQIQEFLDHKSMKTTKRYLHVTDRTIREIGGKIGSVMSGEEEKPGNILKIG